MSIWGNIEGQQRGASTLVHDLHTIHLETFVERNHWKIKLEQPAAGPMVTGTPGCHNSTFATSDAQLVVGRTTPSYGDLVSSQHLSGGRCFIASHAGHSVFGCLQQGCQGGHDTEKTWWKAVAMAGRDLYGKRFNERTKTWMFLEMMSQIIHLLVDMW